ncbi:hypothetical protein JZ751_001018, partial [Albula glossodonta]
MEEGGVIAWRGAFSVCAHCHCQLLQSSLETHSLSLPACCYTFSPQEGSKTTAQYYHPFVKNHSVNPLPYPPPFLISEKSERGGCLALCRRCRSVNLQSCIAGQTSCPKRCGSSPSLPSA